MDNTYAYGVLPLLVLSNYFIIIVGYLRQSELELFNIDHLRLCSPAADGGNIRNFIKVVKHINYELDLYFID